MRLDKRLKKLEEKMLKAETRYHGLFDRSRELFEKAKTDDSKIKHGFYILEAVLIQIYAGRIHSRSFDIATKYHEIRGHIRENFPGDHYLKIYLRENPIPTQAQAI